MTFLLATTAAAWAGCLTMAGTFGWLLIGGE